MKLFLALGMEMGSWVEDEKIVYNIMVNDNRIILTEDQYNVWLLGQQAGFTLETAAMFLKRKVLLVDMILRELLDLKAAIYWSEETLDDLGSYYITPRGHAVASIEKKEQELMSYAHAQPVAVNPFGHSLWMYSNGLVPINKILAKVVNSSGLSEDEAYTNCYYWIPFLVRHGLAILNPPRR